MPSNERSRWVHRTGPKPGLPYMHREDPCREVWRAGGVTQGTPPVLRSTRIEAQAIERPSRACWARSSLHRDEGFPDAPAPPRSASHHTVALRDIVYAVDVGRRGRQRSEQARAEAATPVDRMARVHVSDETWAAFRAQLGVTPVSVGLGRLVERSVAQESRRSASDPQGVRVALDDARTVAKELESLIARLERTQKAGIGRDG